MLSKNEVLHAHIRGAHLNGGHLEDLVDGSSLYAFEDLSCSGRPQNTSERELFGYEELSPSGTRRAEHGVLERCTAGTVLLDEIAELPRRLQARLLIVMDLGMLSRACSRERLCDVRMMAPPRTRIDEALAFGTMRTDI